MRKETLLRLWRYITRHRRILWLLIAAALAANGLSLAAPYLSGRAIDYMAGAGRVQFGMVGFYVLILLAVYLISAAATWATTALTAVLSNKTIEQLRKDAFQTLGGLPLRFFDGHAHGDIISRLTNDMEFISEGLLQGVTQLFSGVVTVLGTLGVMLWLNWKITLAILAITALCIFVSKAIASRSGAMFRKQSQTIGELNGYIEEMIGNQKVVKAFSYEDEAQKIFEEINGRLQSCGQKAQFYSSLVNPTTRYINNLAYICVGVLGGLSALADGLSVGVISSFLIYATQFARPINEMTGILTQLQSAAASAERIFAMMDEAPESADRGEPFEAERGAVTFRNVSFRYQPDRPLIQNLNIRVNPGETVAIVGPTGAGKTTLVNLLMRFYDVDEGQIAIDGVPITEIPRDSLRKNFAMVLQESWLFAGTVRENISYGVENATDEDIERAARAAHAHSFIKRLPQGYDTMITEEGGNLSQGQKQLLTIARAMLADPKILILDEATSSVDTMTEQRIQKAFLAMMKGRTSFVIAHRLSTVRGADLILVMKDGAIVEQGTHKTLLAQNGLYAQLYRSY